VSWFIILFTGALPEGLANLQVMYMRYSTRTSLFAAFMKEEYPPFTFSTTPADPGDDARIRVEVTPQLTNRNRLTTAFRIILVIPHVIVLLFLFLGAAVSVLIAVFAVLFTARWPEGLRDFVVNVMRWGLRVQAYLLLLTDEYPPFALY
jgi:hypothetical protein